MHIYHRLVMFVLAIGVTIGFSVSAFAQLCSTHAPTTYTIASSSYDGSDREYIVHVPAGGAAQKPVVYGFHGASRNPVNWGVTAELEAFADQADIIVVAPIAQPTPETIAEDPVNPKKAWYAGDLIDPAAATHDDNVFIGDLIMAMDAEVCTSNERYAMGHSSGGVMAMQIGCLRNDQFEAVGAAAAGFFESSCTGPGSAMPLMMVHNLRDEVVPFMSSYLFYQEWGNRHLCHRTSIEEDIHWDPSVMHKFRCSRVDIHLHRLAFVDGQLGGLNHAWPTSGNSGKNATEAFFEFFGLIP